jgi:hypothetical protein
MQHLVCVTLRRMTMQSLVLYLHVRAKRLINNDMNLFKYCMALYCQDIVLTLQCPIRFTA